jgi:nucleoid-associated protein YgaU
MKSFLILIVLLGLSVSCANKKENDAGTWQDDTAEAGTVSEVNDNELVSESEAIEDEEIAEDNAAEEIESGSAESSEIAVSDGQNDESDPVDSVTNSLNESSTVSANVAPINESTNDSNQIQTIGSGQYGEYVVQKNDTLMIIAFKIYGDYRMWRNLFQENRSIITNASSIEPGLRIRYEYPASKFEWNPDGLPYLISRGDTLMGISHKVYNSYSFWRSIFENNRPLIRDPNLIFAGLTIYYLEKPSRATASQP